MSDKTKIEWADATVNAVNGCTVISPGCTNCYAMRLAGTRLRNHPSRAGLTQQSKAGPVWNGTVRLNEAQLMQPLKWREPRKIFWNAHGDLFHDAVPNEWIDKVFAVCALTPQHTHMILTKRPKRMRDYVGNPETPFRIARAMAALDATPDGPEELRNVDGFPGYLVSSHGHVYSDKRGKRKRLSPTAGDAGHLRVPLFREGGPRRGERMLVHRIVLNAFDGPPPTVDCQGRHLDGNAGNNAIANLAWGDQSDNWQDSKRHGSFRRYSKLSGDQVAAIRDRASKGEAAYSIAKDFPVSDTQIRNIITGKQWVIDLPFQWPLAAVWLGVSVEDQERADERIQNLLETPAAIRFISAEPLLGPLDLREIQYYPGFCVNSLTGCCDDGSMPDQQPINWVIVGAESGPGARPMANQWAQSIVDQCRETGTAVFVKQLSSGGSKAIHAIEAFPLGLQVRQFPEVASS